MFLAYELQKQRKINALVHGGKPPVLEIESELPPKNLSYERRMVNENKERRRLLLNPPPPPPPPLPKPKKRRIIINAKAKTITKVGDPPEIEGVTTLLGTDDEWLDVKQKDCKQTPPPSPTLQAIAEPPEPHIGVCPHCKIKFMVYKTEIGCQIFRHGVYKSNGEQINPHAPKEFCDQMVREGKIWGCGKPFKYDGTKAEVCEYL